MDQEKDRDPEKDNQEFKYDDPDFDWDAYFTENDKEWEQEKQVQKKQKTKKFRMIGWIIVVVLLINGLAIWPQIINLPAIDFLATSSRLSQQEDIKAYKQSVVTIDWDGVKGTGFNIDSSGLIITNEHVVGHANKVNVHFKAGHSYVGTVLEKYPELDIAIVDIEAENLPVLSLSFEKQWEVGDEVNFIGNPLAFTQIANEGEIVGETSLRDMNVPLMMIQAPIYKGNSGSPVINKKGEVIGVIFATLRNPSIDTKEIVGVATPTVYIQEILKKVTEE
ncbi:trypsin-like peptidase domain-containing protein [Bacillus salitolerans]|uniref:Trypsin-like peptidase domain-containing protein n=1 Tax=Bacillus salitolerans TaxID=1437434 RepID=A0ABW4LWP6_9BACI